MRHGGARTPHAPPTTSRAADTADQTAHNRIEPLLHPMSNFQLLRGPPSKCPSSGGHCSASRKHAPLHQREEAKGNGNRERHYQRRTLDPSTGRVYKDLGFFFTRKPSSLMKGFRCSPDGVRGGIPGEYSARAESSPRRGSPLPFTGLVPSWYSVPSLGPRMFIERNKAATSKSDPLWNQTGHRGR